MFGTLTARLVAGGEVLAERTFEAGVVDEETSIPTGMGATDVLIVSLGSQLGLEQALLKSRAKPRVVHLSDLAALPTEWFGYEGVDAVVISASDAAQFRALSGNRRGEALVEYVQMGGRTLLCVGRQAPEILGPEAPLARLAPGVFDEIVDLRTAAALESFSGSSERVPLEGVRSTISAARLKEVRGSILAYEGPTPSELPLIVRGPLG
jgi:hypothetical protein